MRDASRLFKVSIAAALQKNHIGGLPNGAGYFSRWCCIYAGYTEIQWMDEY